MAETGPRQRVVVADFSVAACAGLKRGDEVLAIADRTISNGFDVERALWHTKPGQKVNMKVVRGGERMTVQLTLLPGNDGGEIAQVQPQGRQAGKQGSLSGGNRD